VWATVYDPARKSVSAAYEFVKETLNAGKQYLDWFQGGSAATLEAIPPGSGAIVRKGAKLLAVYRDEMGACHARSAACPHLGGVVSWNPAEKSWDCPVHGSRFDVDGRVLNGPSPRDLACVDLEDVPHAAPDMNPKPAR
jgi:Rieske Fe-S protein